MAATVPELLQGYSQALYSTWVWYRPFRVLFDCGESVALRLQNAVFGIRHLFLSHGHLDHLAGLPTLLNIRNNGLGDNTQPLTIAGPKNDILLAWMVEYVDKSAARGQLEIEWLPLVAGDVVKLDETRSVEAFPTEHVPQSPTLGYRVVEHRRRLRPELREASAETIRELAREGGRDAVSEPFAHPLLIYGGDGLSPPIEVLRGAELAILEATFLTAEERGRPTHATVDEQLAAATAAEVRTVVIMHVSGRYRGREVRRAIAEAAARHGYPGDVYLLWRERLGPVVCSGQPVG